MRRRSLTWLTVLLFAGAAAAWSVRWAVETGRIHSTPALRTLMAAEWTLLVAALVSLGLLAAFRSMELALRRQKVQAARSVGQLQVVAAILVAVAVVAILVGDFSATLISLGIVGFGLTLALQRPILAVAGWATIFFGGMFREGDRIQVGELEGDVLTITLFTTRLWEIGAPDSRSPGRPTARIRTVSNAMFLEEPVANATSDTAVVFDEFVVGVAFEADIPAAQELLEEVGRQVLDPGRHEAMARTYTRLTRGLKMETYFPDQPRILMDAKPSWMELRLRYLVDARQASSVQTRLTQAWTDATAQRQDMPQVYPRTQPMRIGADGRAVESSPN